MPIAVAPANIPLQQKFEEVGDFPLVLKQSGETDLQSSKTWIEENKEMIERELMKHGAILFRGFPVRTPDDFDVFVKGFGYENFPYVGGAAPRNVVSGNVYTTNESPPELNIPFHHEMAQVPNWPKKLFFFCHIPAVQGGETPIVHSHEVYKKCKERFPEYVEKLETLGTKYVRVMSPEEDNTSPIGRSWRATFGVQTKEEAEARCRELDMDFEWIGDDMKTITKTPIPPVQIDARTGTKVWFNSIVAAFTGWNDSRNVGEKAVIFGDNSLIPKEWVFGTRDIMNELCVPYKWEQGDVCLIDNRQVLHSRRAFTVPRVILASLTKS